MIDSLIQLRSPINRFIDSHGCRGTLTDQCWDINRLVRPTASLCVIEAKFASAVIRFEPANTCVCPDIALGLMMGSRRVRIRA